MSLIETMISWFNSRRGRVSYSMNYRNGPTSYDCSSAIYFALQASGLDAGRIGNTDSMFSDLPRLGWEKIGLNAFGSYDAQRGDIFIWGTPGASGGTAGHTGIFTDSDNILHCNFGYNSITLNNHDYIWSKNGCPQVTIFRYKGANPAGAVTETATGTCHGVEFAAEFSDKAPHWVVEQGDTLTAIASYYGVPEKTEEIARYNRIPNPDFLTIGQKVFIPKPLVWVVEPGETADAANAHYGYAAGTIEALNPGKPWAPGQVFTAWG